MTFGLSDAELVGAKSAIDYTAAIDYTPARHKLVDPVYLADATLVGARSAIDSTAIDYTLAREKLVDPVYVADATLIDAELDRTRSATDYTCARRRLADSIYGAHDARRRLTVCRERGVETAVGLDAAVRNSARADAVTNSRINDARMLGVISRERAIDHEAAEVAVSNQEETVRCLAEQRSQAEAQRAVLQEGVVTAQVVQHQARRDLHDATDKLRVAVVEEIDAQKKVRACKAASIAAEVDSEVLQVRANFKRKAAGDAVNGYKVARTSADHAASVATHAEVLVKEAAHARDENRLLEGSLRSDLAIKVGNAERNHADVLVKELALARSENRLLEGSLRSDLLIAVDNAERNWGGLMLRRGLLGGGLLGGGLLGGAYRRRRNAHWLLDTMI